MSTVALYHKSRFYYQSVGHGTLNRRHAVESHLFFSAIYFQELLRLRLRHGICSRRAEAASPFSVLRFVFSVRGEKYCGNRQYRKFDFISAVIVKEM